MKKLIVVLVFVLTFMGCDNEANGIPEVPAYKPEDGLTFIGKWKTSNVWEFTITNSSNIYIRRNDRDVTWVGTYKLSDQRIGDDGMIGQYEEGIITYTVTHTGNGQEWFSVNTYHLTKDYIDLDIIPGHDWVLGTTRYFRVN
jgi:uncharacterized lipoprotein NlpE involved in copper resistance